MQFYVKDIMTTELVTIKENISIRDAIKIFSSNKISGLPILDQDYKLVGVISASDIIKNKSSSAFFSVSYKGETDFECLQESKFLDHPVSTVMTKELFCIEPGATIAKMAKIMYENKIHRLLVSEYDKLVGIVTTFDLLKLIATSDENIVV